MTGRRWRRNKPRKSSSGGFFDFLGDLVEGIFDIFN